MDLIMTYASMALIAMAILGIYGFLFAVVFPDLLSPSYKKRPISDRGIGKYNFPNGRGVVYEPELKYREYLKKYVLFVYKDKKYIKCRLDQSVDSIRYEVVAFDNKNKVIKVLERSENIVSKGKTKNVMLPDNTSYASVVVRCINEEKYFDTLRYFSKSKWAIFAATTGILTLAVGFLTRNAVLHLAELAYADVNLPIAVTLISSLAVAALVIGLATSMYNKKSR